MPIERILLRISKTSMIGELIVGLLFILGAAIWRGINVWGKAPGARHSFAEYADAFFFPDEDQDR